MSKQWQDEFLDKGKEIMGVDCSGLIGVVSKLLLDEKNRTRSELTDELLNAIVMSPNGSQD